jgi:hypothetical protein
MEQQKPSRSRPACGSSDYFFRMRKKIETDPEKGEPEAVETNTAVRRVGRIGGSEWR